ncbi:sulfate transporter CysZ [Thalassotalea atypica]|uniref:sulfate transporter CysZ n=1 Tax=Thalassotalea atypica TaxID=2054316 RepID=UPI002574392C|nr:sulfate transporter CysZ [Thalassotalea atypica]
MYAQSGAGYFIKGFELIRTKGIRRFVFIPLTINLLIFAVAFYFLIKETDVYLTQLSEMFPEWLSFINFLLWPLAVLSSLILFSFVFSAVANWIAAPFNGLLSEKMESLLTKQSAPSGGAVDIVKDIPRTLSREWCKFKYYLPRAIGFFLLMWVLPFIGQVIWFLFVAWMMAIQYKDYPFDNHKIPFDQMRQELSHHRSLSYSFGITVALFSMIPLINLVVMPVAICGATALWVDRYKSNLS